MANTKIPRAVREEAGSVDPRKSATNRLIAENLSVITCPQCGEKDPDKITTRNTPYEILRTCTTCKLQFSGGSMAMASPDFSDPIPEPGIANNPEDDVPSIQNYGAPHRNVNYEED